MNELTIEEKNYTLRAAIEIASKDYPTGSEWDHAKTGGPYQIIGYAKLNLPDGEARDGQLVILYTRYGLTFARPVQSFADRFTRRSTPPDLSITPPVPEDTPGNDERGS